MRHRVTAARRAAIAAAVPVLLLSACAGAVSEAGEPPDATGAASDVPQDEREDLRRYYDQELTWGSCDDFVRTTVDAAVFAADDRTECARMQVPLDYDDPDAERASIAVLRVPATEDRIGSLVTNPGGPGGPGLAQGALTAAAWAQTAIADRFDIVGMDPRGVGATEPSVDCFSDDESDAGQAVTTLLGQAGSWTADDTRDLAERCARGSGGEESLTAVGSRDVARDLDVLRAVLGDEQLTYVGQSYGTRYGTLYGEMFPDHVRAMVLDGAVDPDLAGAERKVSQFEGFQRSLDRLAVFCVQQGECVLGDEPAQATQRFLDVVQPLLDEPVPAGGGRTLDYNLAVGAVLAGLYARSTWPAILTGLTEIEAGRGETMLALHDGFGGRDADGVWSNYLEANLAISCMDEQRRTPEEETALRRELIETAPLLDTGPGGAEGARDACEAWPDEPTLEHPYAQDVDADLPDTLTVSITGDPAAPYEAGVTLADRLDGALLTVEGERHTIAMSGESPCVNQVVVDYLVELETPAEGASCAL